LNETASKIKTDVEIYPADLSIKENCYKLHDKFKDEEIDLFINGAGFGLFGDTWDIDLDRELSNINNTHTEDMSTITTTVQQLDADFKDTTEKINNNIDLVSDRVSVLEREIVVISCGRSKC
jgi:hypothetical protein